MPLPIFHTYAGYTVFKGTRNSEENRKTNWLLLGWSVLLANGADFDFVPGVLLGDPTHYHRGYSHTLGGALVAGLLTALLALALRRGNEVLRWFTMAFTAYYSHVILDFLGGTSRPMLLFWPLIPKYYHCKLNLFLPLDIPFESGMGGFLKGFASSSFVIRASYEAFLVAAFVFGGRALRAVREPALRRAPAVIASTLVFMFFLGFIAMKAVAAAQG